MQASLQSRGPTAHAVAFKTTGSEAKRNAEALFESRTVAEIREIEVRTRKDIDVKKQQLRQLVGDSYRDLIDSADKIVSIATNCEHILNNVRGIQGGFTSLAHSFTTADSLLNEKRDSLTKHEELYAVGSRVKYLVDTPELIWGCLDSKQHMNAARRYLRAEQVYTMLTSSFASDILAKFPLLSHQWPLVEKFKKQISDVVSSTLASETALSSHQATDALAAACALDTLDSQAALGLLLSTRRTWLKSQLTALHDSTSCSTQEVGSLLASLAQSVQLTIQQVGELFLAGSKAAASAAAPAMEANACALQAAAKEDDLELSELLFGGRDTSGGASSGEVRQGGPEAEAWRRANKALQERLITLSSGVVERACLQWVREVAHDFAALGPALLRTCTTAQDLVVVEEAVAASVNTGPHSKARQATSSTAAASGAGMPSKRQLSTPSTIALVGAGSAASLTLVQPAHSWEAVCEWVLGAPLQLWQEVFHAPFVARAKELVAASFTAVAAAVEGPLTECLAEAAAAPAEPAGQVGTTRWPMAPIDMNEEVGLGAAGGAMHRTWSEKVGALSHHALVTQGTKGATFRLRVHAIRQRFDDELLEVLRGVVLLLGPDANHHHHLHHYSASAPSNLNEMPDGHTAASTASGRKRDGTRATELEPFVQQQCVELAASLVAMLQAWLDKVGVPAAGVAGAAAAEQVVLLGRVCSALAGDSKYLPVLLGSPEGWRQAVGTSPGSMGRASGVRGGGGRAPPPSVRLQGVINGFKATGIAAYKQWAAWGAACLVETLRATLLSDDTLESTSTPVSWQVTVIAGTGGADPADLIASGLAGGDTGGEMRFHLPGCPTPAVLLFLNAACAEVRRAGDHTTAVEALQVFEWELAGAALECYAQIIGPKGALTALGAGAHSYGRPAPDTPTTPTRPATTLGGRLSEKGVLQLLADVRFLRDVLAGGRPLNPRTAAAATVGSGGGAGAGAAPAPAPPPPLLVDPQDPGSLAALAERKRMGVALEQQLQDRLDPIDWATYEPYLWANVKRYYHRTSALFGMLVQLQRAHGADVPASGAGRSTGTGTAGGVVDLNPLNVLPVAPRFQYLPISTPSAAGLAAAKARPSAQPFRRVPSGDVSHSDMAAAFSFADVCTGLRGAGGNESGAVPSAAAGGAGPLGALQARLHATGALGSLSSMLGDKAAEMTAMAQQRFDSFSDLGSGLGGFLGGAAGGLGTGLGSNLLSHLTKGVGGAKK